MKEGILFSLFILGGITGAISGAVADEDDRAGAALRGGVTGLLTTGGLLGITAAYNRARRRDSTTASPPPPEPERVAILTPEARNAVKVPWGGLLTNFRPSAQVGTSSEYNPSRVVVSVRD